MLSLLCVVIFVHIAYPQAEVCAFKVVKLDVQIRPVYYMYITVNVIHIT